jgi:hypothetical protein
MKNSGHVKISRREIAGVWRLALEEGKERKKSNAKPENNSVIILSISCHKV